MITLCGLAHLDFNMAGAHGYEQYLTTIDALDLGPAAREQAFRRIVFNVAAVNRDDHTKNHAFVCDQAGTWRLAPAYDVTFSWSPTGAWTATHQMSIGAERDGIDLRDLTALADRFAVPGCREAIADVLAAVDRWRELADKATLDTPRIDAIAQAHRQFRPT